MDEPIGLNRQKVRIAGEEFTILSDKSEETVLKVAEFVNKKFDEVSNGFSSAEKYRMAVLAALNIAGELFDEQNTREELAIKLGSYVDRAKQLVDKAVF